jgi:hypothetical protein
MPANAGIHVFLRCDNDKTAIPAFAGMTWGWAKSRSFGCLVLY